MLGPLGLHLARRDRAFDMDGLLMRAARRAPAIGTWIDVGASNGIWSVRARNHFPTARFVLFEPLAERQQELDRLRSSFGFEIVAAAAGAAPGTISFVIDPQLDGSGVAGPDAESTRSVPVETVDRVVASRRLSGPFALKLDTHGHEIAVLTGAAETLRRTELLVIETYNFQLTPDCLRFHELCLWLEQRGFRCCDLADPMRRPSDGAFWQMDLAFAPVNSPLFASNCYEVRQAPRRT
jgi:FkbM family methyltransferase